MAAKFELYKDKSGEFRFRLKAGNGEIILVSEGYKQKASALNGIESVQKTQQTTPITNARSLHQANHCSISKL